MLAEVDVVAAMMRVEVEVARAGARVRPYDLAARVRARASQAASLHRRPVEGYAVVMVAVVVAAVVVVVVVAVARIR